MRRDRWGGTSTDRDHSEDRIFDYANKYQDGATEEVCPANISEEISERMKELTVRAFHALKLNVYSRADFLLDEKGNLYCLEVNTLPGMTAASLLPKEANAAGIAYGDLCELIIKNRWKHGTSKERIYETYDIARNRTGM